MTSPQSPQPERKACSRCGAPFDCGARMDHCWCQQLPPLTTPDASTDCLCPQCLDLLTDAPRTAEPRDVV